MSVMGALGGFWRPGTAGGGSSDEISAISTNSNARMRRTSLEGRDAPGVEGPGLWILGGDGGLLSPPAGGGV